MVSGEPLLGDDGTTDYIPALQHLDIEPGACEVSGGDQSVMPGTDDDDLCVLGHGKLLVCGVMATPRRISVAADETEYERRSWFGCAL